MDQHRDSEGRSLKARTEDYNAATSSSNVVENVKEGTSSKQYINAIEGNSSSSSDQRPLFGYGPGIPAYELDIRRKQGINRADVTNENPINNNGSSGPGIPAYELDIRRKQGISRADVTNENPINNNSSSSSDQRPLFGYGPGVLAYELDIRREQGMDETQISKELYAIATQAAAGVLRAHIGG
jgi:hypothetical protein